MLWQQCECGRHRISALRRSTAEFGLPKKPAVIAQTNSRQALLRLKLAVFIGIVQLWCCTPQNTRVSSHKRLVVSCSLS